MEIRSCTNCHCLSNEDFKQVANLRNSGLIIYIHHKKSKVKRNYGDHMGSHIILHNTSNRDIKRFDYIVELCRYKTKCLKCKMLIQRVRDVIEEISIINKNDVIGVCDFCKRSHGKNKCRKCQYLVKKFVTKKAIQYENREEQFKLLLSKLQQILFCIFESNVICKHNISLDSEYKTQLYRLLNSLNSHVPMRQPEIGAFLELFDRKETAVDYDDSEKLVQDLVTQLKYKEIVEDSYADINFSSSGSESECICKHFLNNKSDRNLAPLDVNMSQGNVLSANENENVSHFMTSSEHQKNYKSKSETFTVSLLTGQKLKEGRTTEVSKTGKLKGNKENDLPKQISKNDVKNGTEKSSTEKMGTDKKGIEKSNTEKMGTGKKGAEKSSTEKMPTEKKGAEKRRTETTSAEKKGAEKRRTETMSAEKKGAEKRRTETMSAEKKGAEKRRTETMSAEKKGAEKSGTEKKAAEKKGAEKSSTEKMATGKKGTEKSSIEKMGTGKRGAEKSSTEKMAAEKKGAEKRRTETTSAEKKGAEKRRTETMSAEKKGAEKRRTETMSAEKKGAEKRRTETMSAEKKGAEKSGTEKKAAEKKGAEKSSTEKMATGKKGTEKSSIEKMGTGKRGAEKSSTEKMAAEKKGAEKSSTKKMAAEKKGAEKSSNEKMAAGKNGTEKSSIEKMATERKGTEKSSTEKMDTGKKSAEKIKKGIHNSEYRLMLQLLKDRQNEKDVQEKLGKSKAKLHLPVIKDLPKIKRRINRLKAIDSLDTQNSDSILECKYEHLDVIDKMIKGTDIVHLPSHYRAIDEGFERLPLLFKFEAKISEITNEKQSISLPIPEMEAKKKIKDKEITVQSTGILKYELSNREFIEKGWTTLPSTKIMRRMNIYKMLPASDKYDWFKTYNSNQSLFYNTGERFAEINENGGGKWFYKNGNVALDGYTDADTNVLKRYVIYSSGEEIVGKKKEPITILACFDYCGNGVVYDGCGNVRLKYNQSEGVLVDKNISAPGRWKWHTLNDPPVLQPVFFNTYDNQKQRYKNKDSSNDLSNSEIEGNEEMTAIELQNLAKEKAHKLMQKFKPFQVRIKALKINDIFSLRILDQANIFLLFRCDGIYFKISIGMVLNSREIIGTDIAEVSEVSTPYDIVPPRSPSLVNIQNRISNVRKHYHSSKKNK